MRNAARRPPISVQIALPSGLIGWFRDVVGPAYTLIDPRFGTTLLHVANQPPGWTGPAPEPLSMTELGRVRGYRPNRGPSCSDRQPCDLLCPLLTSARPSRRLSTPVAQGSCADLPGYDAPTFTLMPVGYTSHRSVQVSGFDLFGCLTPMRRLVSASCSSGQRFASGFLQTRSRPRNPCLWLTLPLAGCVEDSHLQVSAPCRAHQKKTGASAGQKKSPSRGP